MNTRTRICALGMAILGLDACHRGTAHSDLVSGVAKGTYRAVLELPGGEPPFGLELGREGAATVEYLLNGKERVRLNEVAVAGGDLEIRMPGFENRLTADATGDQLAREVGLSKSEDRKQGERGRAVPVDVRRRARGAARRVLAHGHARSGPATGEHYTQFVDEVKTTLDQLLAES